MFSKVNRRRGDGAPPSIISNDMRLKGDLKSDGEVHIDGVIDGDVRAARLTVGDGGVVNGMVTADEALIRGTINGEVHSDAITLARSARVTGDVLHQTLTIEPGAFIEGHCRRLERSVATGDSSHVNLVVGGPKTVEQT